MRNFYEQFKTLIITIIIIFVAFFVYTKLAGPIPFAVNSVQTTQTDLFTAEGVGEATAVPDTGAVNLGVTAQGATVADAQNKANQTSEKIISAIKKLGIQDKDIKTTNYSVSPNYGQSAGGVEPLIYPGGGDQKITSYTVNQELLIKVKSLEKVNSVIDTATQNGANLVGGVYFTFSDDLQKSLEKKARDEAVKNAKEKAEGLANSAGVRLGKIINVVESGNGGVMPMVLKAQGNATTDSTTPTNVTPGENSVTVTVTLYYQTY